MKDKKFDELVKKNIEESKEWDGPRCLNGVPGYMCGSCIEIHPLSNWRDHVKNPNRNSSKIFSNPKWE